MGSASSPPSHTDLFLPTHVKVNKRLLPEMASHGSLWGPQGRPRSIATTPEGLQAGSLLYITTLERGGVSWGGRGKEGDEASGGQTSRELRVGPLPLPIFVNLTLHTLPFVDRFPAATILGLGS